MTHQGYVDEPRPGVHTWGGSVAALLAAAFALLVLGLVVTATELNASFNAWVFGIGKAWMPHADRVGPYSGKETLTLVAWAASWIVLHFAMRNRRPDVRVSIGISFVMILAGTLLVWPPVWHFLGA